MAHSFQGWCQDRKEESSSRFIMQGFSAYMLSLNAAHSQPAACSAALRQTLRASRSPLLLIPCTPPTQTLWTHQPSNHCQLHFYNLTVCSSPCGRVSGLPSFPVSPFIWCQHFLVATEDKQTHILNQQGHDLTLCICSVLLLQGLVSTVKPPTPPFLALPSKGGFCFSFTGSSC